jgi:hypothetical protein
VCVSVYACAFILVEPIHAYAGRFQLCLQDAFREVHKFAKESMRHREEREKDPQNKLWTAKGRGNVMKGGKVHLETKTTEDYVQDAANYYEMTWNGQKIGAGGPDRGGNFQMQWYREMEMAQMAQQAAEKAKKEGKV